MDTNVFVKFLPSDINDETLHHLFSRFGSIISAKVMVHPVNGSSLGYGFVLFTSPEEANQAISCMSGYRILNKSLMCKLSNAFTFSDPSPNLYIKPLPVEFTEQDINDLFGKFGDIETTKIVKCDEISINSNVGFVRYTSVESASQAISEMNGTKLPGQGMPLIVKFAESDVRRAVRKANNSSKSGTLERTNSQNALNNTPYGNSPTQYYPPSSYQQAMNEWQRAGTQTSMQAGYGMVNMQPQQCGYMMPVTMIPVPIMGYWQNSFIPYYY